LVCGEAPCGDCGAVVCAEASVNDNTAAALVAPSFNFAMMFPPLESDQTNCCNADAVTSSAEPDVSVLVPLVPIAVEVDPETPDVGVSLLIVAQRGFLPS
jgi:hypothetical protein